MKSVLRIITLVSTLFVVSPAFAVCTGQFLGGTLCGNNTTLQNVLGPSANPVLGVPGTNTGTLGFAGSSSGTASITPQAVAGTPILTLPTGTGTFAVNASGPLVLSSTTGALTCPTCVTGTSGALTNGTTPTSGYSNTQILGSNGSVLSAYSVSGSGNVALTTSPVLTTPSLGVATGTSLALNGAVIGSNALAVTGTASISSTLTLPSGTISSILAIQILNGASAQALQAGSLCANSTFSNCSTTPTNGLQVQGQTTLSSTLTYGGVTLNNAVTGTGNMVLSTSPVLTGSPTTSTYSRGTFNTGIASNAFVFNNQPYTSAIAFGVKCDGTTDDTADIALAIAGTPAGGSLVLPSGSCLVSGSGSTIFTITNPINIFGMGSSNSSTGTTILVASSVPTTTDIFHIVGVSNSTLRGYTFSNFNVSAQGSSGKHVFHFDTTAGTTTNLAEIIISNVVIQAGASSGGFSINLDNGTGTNTNGGIFNFTVQNSYLGGGLNCAFCGDTIRVLNNLISTANAAITLQQVAGAGNFLMHGNNVSGQSGGAVIAAGVAPIIAYNEFEQQATNLEANNSIIDITGSGINVSNPKVFGNQLQANAGTGNPTLLRIAAATAAYYDANRFGTPASYSPVVITAASTGAIIGAGNQYVGVSTNFTDSGSGTVQATYIAGPTVFGPIYAAGNGGLVSTAAMSNGQLLVGQTSAAPLPKTLSQDCSLAASGALTCTKTNNVAFAASATTDTTNANNISSGNLPAGRAPTGGTNLQFWQTNGSGTAAWASISTPIMGTTGSTTLAASSTTFISPGISNATESLAYVPWPYAGTVRNLSVFSQGAPGAGQSYTFTFRDAGTNTAVTCAISGNASNSCQDLTHSVAVAAGDRWDLQSVFSVGASGSNVLFSFEFDRP